LEDVALDAERLHPQTLELFDDALDPVRLPLGHHDRGAVLAEMQRHPPPDPLPGTGDHHDLAVDTLAFPHDAQSDTGVRLRVISVAVYKSGLLCRPGPKKSARPTRALA
ncbi:MAG: hypothetical protein QOG30_43, partial [Acidimicrobiaceae bacterium]